MCRYLGNNEVLGSLFEAVVKCEKDSITFNKIYDILYYASVELNEKERTIILVDREGIYNFVDLYKDSILVNETEEEIKILNKDKVSTFSEIYKIDEEIEKIFTNAIERVLLAA